MGFAGAGAAIVKFDGFGGVGIGEGSEGSEDRVSEVESKVIGGCKVL